MTDEQFDKLKQMGKLEVHHKYRVMLDKNQIKQKEYDYILAKLFDKKVDEETKEPVTEKESLPGGVHDGGASGVLQIVEETNRDAQGDNVDYLLRSFGGRLLPSDSNGAGDTVVGKNDIPRLESKSQRERLLILLSDGNWHNTPEIQEKVYGQNHLGVARIASRICDLRGDGHMIEARKITRSIWAYKMTV